MTETDREVERRRKAETEIRVGGSRRGDNVEGMAGDGEGVDLVGGREIGEREAAHDAAGLVANERIGEDEFAWLTRGIEAQRPEGSGGEGKAEELWAGEGFQLGDG